MAKTTTIQVGREKVKKYLHENAIYIEDDINSLAKFHSQSRKVLNNLRDFCKLETPRVRFFRPPKIMPTRWVASHERATRSIFDHWPVLVKHLKHIRCSPNFSEKARQTATNLLLFLTDRHAMSNLLFQLELQYAFQVIMIRNS